MSSDRQWMYTRLENGWIRPEFITGIEQFVAFAKMHPECMDGEKIRCPCNRRKCQNRVYLDEDTVKVHIGTNGFVPDYYRWYHHGEPYIPLSTEQNTCEIDGSIHIEDAQTFNTMQSMVYDAAGHSFNPNNIGDIPNPTTQHLFEMLSASQQEVWKGNPFGHSQLSAVSRLLNIKAEHHMSERCYDEICQLMSELLPTDNLMTDSFYKTKKLVRGLGLPVEKIDCCENNCMIYWGVDSELSSCKICDHPRYKRQRRGSSKHKGYIPNKIMYYFPISPRLQRLYASNATAKYMRWHAEQPDEEGDVMRHCSNSPAWKHFNQTHPTFGAESRNVRLGLCTDGFQPFGQTGQQYSSWPVILTPYNLPPWMCMKEEYMFLTVIVPGPKNPKNKLDVFLQPLIAELNELWEVGVETYDVSKKQNFQLRAALMWTIGDFPAYSMLSGWNTAGKLACPYCMEEADSFTLTNGRKTSWFDNHRKFLPNDHSWRRNKRWFRKGRSVHKSAPPIRSGVDLINEIDHFGFKKVTEPDGEMINRRIHKVCGCGWNKRSIFWDLPYWKTNLIRHNLDVMHIEKNFFDNIFHTVMNVKGKTKDNAKSREDLKEFCNRPELHRDENENKYPKASYTLDKEGKEQLCSWIKKLKFPDGYMSNLARCIDMSGTKLYKMKSHDCHVFMQRLIPIAFRELLPANVWQPLTELSIFFKDLTSAVITEEDMKCLEEEIPIILCKLERIFPPSFFDSMEHLPVHLAYEARIAGPVQYRWMYPFER